MPEVGFGLEAAEELGLQAGPQAAAGLRQEMPRIDVSWCTRSTFITNPATRNGSKLPFFFFIFLSCFEERLFTAVHCARSVSAY